MLDLPDTHMKVRTANIVYYICMVIINHTDYLRSYASFTYILHMSKNAFFVSALPLIPNLANQKTCIAGRRNHHLSKRYQRENHHLPDLYSPE